ncbi:Uncharacterized protein TCM_032571 [Theobroma cacao]|uniref:Uncharacterized protein n=1 Tax=Theobroma cacao TaxID=3641 RepID=A0A061FA08_THECC|nr:Uncharacterized protein TCM_032571 [Theobroma cacao]
MSIYTYKLTHLDIGFIISLSLEETPCIIYLWWPITCSSIQLNICIFFFCLALLCFTSSCFLKRWEICKNGQLWVQVTMETRLSGNYTTPQKPQLALIQTNPIIRLRIDCR